MTKTAKTSRVPICAGVVLVVAILAYSVGIRKGDPYKVVDIPGKGKGVVAIRDIQQGELIIREHPLFTVPPQIETSPTELIARNVRQLSPSDYEAFFNLSYVNFPSGLDPETHKDQVALAIFQTNAVSAGSGVGIFPRMARLNHGCSSAFNVVYSWRDQDRVLVVHALKAIKKGQELLTTYSDMKRPRSERRAYLSQQYGFACSCDVCSLPDSESQASDQRLIAISNLYERFALWGSQGIGGSEAIEVARQIWHLEDMEGYWSERGRLAADAAWVASAHSDASAAHEWAKLAVLWAGYELGKDSELVTEMQLVAADPHAHHSWGSRERVTVGGL